MHPIKPSDFNQVSEAPGELAAIGFAQQPAAILVDGADLSIGLKRTALAVVPFGMPSDSPGHLFQGLAVGCAAKVEDRETIGRGASLKKTLLKRLAKRMDAPLPLAQIAKAIEELAMVGRQDHDLRVIAAKDRIFEALQRQVALLAIELGKILDKDSQAAIGKPELLDVPLASPNFLVAPDPCPKGSAMVSFTVTRSACYQQGARGFGLDVACHSIEHWRRQADRLHPSPA
jgi:hypothetical protein